MSKQETGTKIAAGVIVVVALGSCFIWLARGGPFAGIDSEALEAEREARNAERYRDDGKQSDRRDLIQRLIDEGVFHKVELPARYPHVYVTDQFSALSVDAKSEFIEVVFAYHSISRQEPVIVSIRDARTGNQIGTFDESFGLTMD